MNKVKNPSVETLKKLAKLFDTPLSYFLDNNKEIEFEVMFRTLQENYAALDEKDRETIDLLAKALKEKKEDDEN